MLWRLPWIIGKSPLSISVYLYVWYVRQSSSVDSPLASPLRHDVSRARSFTVTTNEGYILPSSFQMLTPQPPTHMIEYFLRDLKTFPHGIEQYMRGRFFITWTVIPTQLILLSDVNIVGMEAENFNFAETLGLTTLEVDSLINSSVLVSFAYFTFLCVLCVWELNIKFLFIKFNLLHLCFRLPEIIRDDEQLQHHSRNQGNLTAQSRSLVFL